MVSPSRAPSPAPAALPARRTRAAVSAAYATQGFGFAVMLTNVPTYKDRLGMGDDTITLVILGVCVCAGTGSALSGLAAARYGSGRVVQSGLAVAAAAILAVGLATTWPLFFVSFALYGLALGTVDASMNMQGIDVERLYGRSLLSSFFAANAAGGVLGALSVSGAAALGLGLAASLPLVAAVVVVSVLTLRRDLLARDVLGPGDVAAGPPVLSSPDPGATALDPAVTDAWAPTGVPVSDVAARADVRRLTLVLLGVAMLAFPVADSAVSSWGATFLRDVLEAGAVVAPLGYAAYQATLIASRLCGDAWVGRVGRVTVVRWGGAVGALGLLTVAAAPVWPVALLGFAATGLGLGVVAPLAFSAAGDRAAEAVAAAAGEGTGLTVQPDATVRPNASEQPGVVVTVSAVTDRAVARLNVFTYVGAVLGGALTGVFATAHQLRAGFVVLAALALVSALLASRFRGRAV